MHQKLELKYLVCRLSHYIEFHKISVHFQFHKKMVANQLKCCFFFYISVYEITVTTSNIKNAGMVHNVFIAFDENITNPIILEYHPTERQFSQ